MLPIFRCEFPKMVRIRQRFEETRVGDVEEAVRARLRAIDFASLIKPGMRIAITAGSRGITDLPLVTRTIVDEVRKAGADPFIIPAMGSHGGATAEGQLRVLENIGITEDSMRAPIYSSMDTVQIGATPTGTPVYLDKIASQADGLIVVNRIKPHTTFEGDIQSGLYKMLAVGLGKHQGAVTVHHVSFDFGYTRTIKEIGDVVLENAKVIAGVGIIENAYEQTAEIVVARPEDFERTEKAALLRAKALAPCLPFDDLDVLIVDEIGKNVSGTGMDPKVIGRIYHLAASQPERPRIKRIIVCDLTEGTEGSGHGIGMADFTTRRAFEKIDLAKTYVNSVTAQSPELDKIPMICESDQEALSYTLFTIGSIPSTKARVVRIKNTLHLTTLFISESLLPEAQANGRVELPSEPEEIELDEEGNLNSSW